MIIIGSALCAGPIFFANCNISIVNLQDNSGALVSDGVTDISGIEVLSGGKLVFAKGSIKDYYSTQNGAGIIVEENGFLNLNGGII